MRNFTCSILVWILACSAISFGQADRSTSRKSGKENRIILIDISGSTQSSSKSTAEKVARHIRTLPIGGSLDIWILASPFSEIRRISSTTTLRPITSSLEGRQDTIAEVALNAIRSMNRTVCIDGKPVGPNGCAEDRSCLLFGLERIAREHANSDRNVAIDFFTDGMEDCEFTFQGQASKRLNLHRERDLSRVLSIIPPISENLYPKLKSGASLVFFLPKVIMTTNHSALDVNALEKFWSSAFAKRGLHWKSFQVRGESEIK